MPHCCRCQERLPPAAHPPRKQRSLLERGGEDLDPEKSKRTAKIGQSGGMTALPGAVPATNNDGTPKGNGNQSPTQSAKWLASGHTRCHQGADSQIGINIEVVPIYSRSDLHTFPIKLNGQLTHQSSPLHYCPKALMPDEPLHQCREKNLAHWWLALDAKRSTVWGPHL